VAINPNTKSISVHLSNCSIYSSAVLLASIFILFPAIWNFFIS